MYYYKTIWTERRMSKFSVEYQIFVIVIFFNFGTVLQFGAHSRYYKGALIQNRSILAICTTFGTGFRFG